MIEADESGVPLLVLTADRPPELRGTGANQTIDQLKLYGTAVRWFCEVGVPEARAGMAGYWRSLACRAWALASGAGGGIARARAPQPAAARAAGARTPRTPGRAGPGRQPGAGRAAGWAAPWTSFGRCRRARMAWSRGWSWTERGAVIVCGDGDYDGRAAA